MVDSAACASLAAQLPAAPAARAATPCWKELLNDWYDGRIDRTYPTTCYSQAIDHLPTDVEVYSSAREDIESALAAAIRAAPTIALVFVLLSSE